MDFKKIKFNRSGMSLEVTYLETMKINDISVTNEVVKKCNMIVHNDFIDALAGLKAHFALLCDLREVSTFPERYDIAHFDHEQFLEKIAITGISIGGDDDSAGVVIIGRKELPSGVLNLVTPFTRFDSDYKWREQLEEAVEHLLAETEQYVFDQKWGVKQLEFPFEDFADEAEPFGTFDDVPFSDEKPKKKKPKKVKEVLETAC